MKQITTLFSIMIFSYSVYFSQCNIIYVTPTGTGTGTKASPSGLLNAINVLATGGDHLKLDTGLYTLSNPITSKPFSSKYSDKLDPIKPAAPVTNTLFFICYILTT